MAEDRRTHVLGRTPVAIVVALAAMIVGAGARGQSPDFHRIRVGADVQAAKIVKQTQPVYPAQALQGKISGTVVLHAVVAADGSVKELQYVSGPPHLFKSAMEAVRDWKYQQTLFDGEPIEIDTTISLDYQLIGSGQGKVLAGVEQQPKETPPQPAQQARRIPLGGKMLEAELIKKIEPVYPEKAKAAGITGTVVLQVIIATDGSVQEVKYVSGPPELMQPAVDAVKQWKYKPMQLDGKPVEVESTVSVVYVQLDLPPVPQTGVR
jgi:TonB family protein